MGRFGYVQESFRNHGGFSISAISFSIVSILPGAVTLNGYGLEVRGPPEMSHMLMMPPNELTRKTFLGIFATLILVYFLSARRKFRGPKWI